MCQLLIEAGLLAAIGGFFGIALAYAAVDAWRAFGPASFPRMTDVAVNRGVLVFAGLIVCGSALVAGLIPAWSVSRALHASMNAETRSNTGDRHQGLVRRGFVALQVGSSAILIVCMTLVSRGFARLERVDPGFEPGHALSVQISLLPTRYLDA